MPRCEMQPRWGLEKGRDLESWVPLWSLDLYLSECPNSVATATRLGAASLGEGCGTSQSDTSLNLFVLIKDSLKEIPKTLISGKKRRGDICSLIWEMGNVAESAYNRKKEKTKGQFDFQELNSLFESRDDSSDRPLHKHRAAGSL